MQQQKSIAITIYVREEGGNDTGLGPDGLTGGRGAMVGGEDLE